MRRAQSDHFSVLFSLSEYKTNSAVMLFILGNMYSKTTLADRPPWLAAPVIHGCGGHSEGGGVV